MKTCIKDTTKIITKSITIIVAIDMDNATIYRELTTITITLITDNTAWLCMRLCDHRDYTHDLDCEID